MNLFFQNPNVLNSTGLLLTGSQKEMGVPYLTRLPGAGGVSIGLVDGHDPSVYLSWRYTVRTDRKQPVIKGVTASNRAPILKTNAAHVVSAKIPKT
ncbi:MAG: hypothetical protein NUV69_03150 [Candidatus Curtissbacteria bacterium]|nr:hypothetical protein [Candidatus Curtissbacteria bacterium]